MSLEARLDGPANMARDLALVNGDQLRARVYGWDGAWVSIGRFQDPLKDIKAQARVQWVRRPTGGSAVLHGHDVTVGLVVPLKLIGLGDSSRNLRQVYRAGIAPLVLALNDSGLECSLADKALRCPGQPSGLLADCFAMVSPNDVVNPKTMQKVCGCALKLFPDCVLIQASVPNGPPIVEYSEVFESPNQLRLQSWDASGFHSHLKARLSEMV